MLSTNFECRFYPKTRIMYANTLNGVLQSMCVGHLAMKLNIATFLIRFRAVQVEGHVHKKQDLGRITGDYDISVKI